MNIDFDNLQRLIDIAERADIHALEVVDGDARIHIVCQADGASAHIPAAPHTRTRQNVSQNSATDNTGNDADNTDNATADTPDASNTQTAKDITAPMLGTFYRRSSPDAEAFVEVGAAVEAGQTLCIIEAMKMMHEVKAETTGVVTEILVDDGDIVEYGQALLKLEPNQ
ncbi:MULTISPECIES: acetyl-CoA carboxylase biotin carboxyl carrier protein [unclassified Psychrobacter]|uniref:acetyl-CoA carboxylase biotin carboxyl carrier protein n=1 Tax=unclassified Psychrobacter TaxID=196806 RepID=UPI0018F76077|nr:MULTISPECIES: acetyl-CoA carboxylase biotin carboxyl carrier protein [unclassified Psychrobacter]